MGESVLNCFESINRKGQFDLRYRIKLKCIAPRVLSKDTIKASV